MQELAKDFYTVGSLSTFAGATGVIFVITLTLRRVLNRDYIAIPLVVSLVLSFTLASTADKLHTPLEWFVALANGCLLFLTAAGFNEGIAVGKAPPAKAKVGAAPPDMQQQGARRVPLIDSWFRMN